MRLLYLATAATVLLATPALAQEVNDGSKPHGDKRNAADLRLAYNYCQTELREQFCDGSVCTPIPRDFPTMTDRSPYIDPACVEIEHLWKSSEWKKQDDASDKKAKQDAIERAKAFVAGVMRQKP